MGMCYNEFLDHSLLLVFNKLINTERKIINYTETVLYFNHFYINDIRLKKSHLYIKARFLIQEMFNF